MGRKGVSKRKPTQSKEKPVSGGGADGSVASALRSAENQPARSLDKGSSAPAADRKHAPKKG